MLLEHVLSCTTSLIGKEPGWTMFSQVNPIIYVCVCMFRVEPGVETAFLGTRSGLLRVIRYAGVETRVAR